MALIALLLRTLTGEEAPAKDADDAGPLRPSEVGVLRVCFDSIDADRSGALSRAEFTPWCLRLGLAPSADAAARARAGFARVPALETVVRAGEVLYVPSYWFHYIVSLSQSAQCNTRAGPPPDRRGAETIRRCLARQTGRDLGDLVARELEQHGAARGGVD